MSEWYAVEDPKGQYARLTTSGDGSVSLEPVRVPEHIRKEREERIRQRERRKMIEQNRQRQKALDRRSVVFLSVALALAVIVCCIYLHMMMAVDERVDEITALREELEELTESNDLLETRISASKDIEEAAFLAAEKLGMKEAEDSQIEYYIVDSQDYMLQYEDIE